MMPEIFWLLLPIAAASGWYAATRSFNKPDTSQKKSALRSDYFQGLNYLVNEQPDKAIEVFVRLLEVDNETVETHLALGSLFRKRGEVDRAIRIHQNIIAREGLEEIQRGQALMELGNDYMHAGLLDRAEGLFTELADSRDFSDHALRELTDIYQREKDWDNAVKAARKREVINGRPYGKVIAYYYCEQADLCSEDGDIDQALSYIKRALDVSSQCLRASITEGYLLQRKGNHRAAITAFKRIENQDSLFLPEIINPIRKSYTQLGRITEMTEYFTYLMDRYGGISITLALTEMKAEKEGPRQAAEFLTNQLHQRPSVKGLQQLIELSLDHIDGPSRRYLNILKDLTEKLLENRARYECHYCGFSAKSLHWQCPGCKYWGTLKPIQGIQGE